MTAAEDLVEVHLLELPVRLAAEAREHFEGLTREFVLMSSGDDDHHVPTRLMELVATLRAQFGGVSSAADQRLEDAIDAGQASLADHVLELPPTAGPASQALGAMIDEADEYCRNGRHLLTLATPPELVAYRRWYLGQVVDQLAGTAPVPWPESAEARTAGLTTGR